ncbi:MAG: hypothetical protein P1U85_19740 [Verrucomicrobiales bacterium]|jgi:hypothetical protein|nr:hypothetical protein [Verrucomicrobiales bacterium]
MNNAPDPAPDNPFHAASTPSEMTKREYFAVHLFEAVTANLSLNCSLQDKANHAVDAADALLHALEEKESPAS